MTFEEALRSELSTVTTKIYPITAPEGDSVPYIVYNQSGIERERDLYGHIALTSAKYDIHCFHTNYGALKMLMASIITKLKAIQQKTVGVYVEQSSIENQYEVFESAVMVYRGTIEFKIYYQEG